MKSPYIFNLTIFIIFLTGFLLVLLSGINKSLFLAINSYSSVSNQFIWENLTFLGDTLPATVLMLLFIRKRPDIVWSGIIAALIALVITNSLKYYSGVLRPPAVLDKDLINVFGPVLMRHSFPSGHTVTVFTLAGILVFYFRSIFVRTVLVLLALFVGISRISVGVHWPADVLAGAALGTIFATTGMYSVEKLRWNKSRTGQIIAGIILMCTGIYLLFFYDCGYDQAVYLQYIFTAAVLIAGLREYYLLLKNSQT
jgi:membrane-associated phospholipid phosphatase